MSLNPTMWVDETVKDFGNPPEVVADMIESMRPEANSGIAMPDWWREEALQHLKRRYTQ